MNEELINARRETYRERDKVYEIALRARRRKSFLNKSGIVTLSGDDFDKLRELAMLGAGADLPLFELELKYYELLEKFEVLQKNFVVSKW